MKPVYAKRFKGLEQENTRLKKKTEKCTPACSPERLP